jgi:IS5 family transposase
MTQISLSENGFERKIKCTRESDFLGEINLVVLWAEPVALIARHDAVRGSEDSRCQFAVAITLRIHFLRQCFNLSDPALKEALNDKLMFCELAEFDLGENNPTDGTTNLRCKHFLDKHRLSLQILATVYPFHTLKGLLGKTYLFSDVTLIAAPNSPKNSSGGRHSDMLRRRMAINGASA